VPQLSHHPLRRRCGRSLCWLSLCTRSRRLPRSSRSSRSLDGRGRCSRRPTAASRTPACHRAAKAIVRAPRSVTQLSHVRARILLSHATERCCIRAVFFNYIFLESENDPKNDPVIIWCVLLPKAASRRPRALADCRRLVSGHTRYNGGPGAASMFGLFVELGPYYLNQDSFDDPKYNETGIPQVQRNPYGWTKVANVVRAHGSIEPVAGRIDRDRQAYRNSTLLPCSPSTDRRQQPAADRLLLLRRRQGIPVGQRQDWPRRRRLLVRRMGRRSRRQGQCQLFAQPLHQRLP
jgi:hypothetical protein